MSLMEAIDKIRLGVVQIVFYLSPEPQEFIEFQARFKRSFLNIILGSGFFVNSEAHIITANHVIQKGREFFTQYDIGIKKILIGIGLPNSDYFIGNTVLEDFQIIEEDSEHDISILKMNRNPFQNEVNSGLKKGGRNLPVPAEFLQLNGDRPIEGEEIGISGYPLQERVLITNFGHIASIWKSPYYLADIEVNPGNSGGPVYLVNDASVIGLCVSYKPSPIRHLNGVQVEVNGQPIYTSSGLTNIIPIRYAIDLLKRNNIEYSIVHS